ncbi:MAG TPA: flagellar biosynthetic protein FliO [Terriglobales bacterium]|nr:flagellar biosynthetic protein FliO [Terriglobales bacterium]
MTLVFPRLGQKLLWRWLGNWRGRRSAKRLRVAETVQLGERRFLAVVEFESRRFLIAGTASSIALLSDLPPTSQDAAEESAIEITSRRAP